MMNTTPSENDASGKSIATGAPIPTDAEYHARIDAEYEAKRSQLKRNKLIKMLTFILLLGGAVGGGYIWYHAKPENQQKLQSVLNEAAAAKDSIKEGTSVSGIMETYEEGLDEVAKHGDSVNSASAALVGEGELNLESPADRAPAEVTENKAAAQSAQDTNENANPESSSDEAPKRRGF